MFLARAAAFSRLRSWGTKRAAGGSFLLLLHNGFLRLSSSQRIVRTNTAAASLRNEHQVDVPRGSRCGEQQLETNVHAATLAGWEGFSLQYRDFVRHAVTEMHCAVHAAAGSAFPRPICNRAGIR